MFRDARSIHVTCGAVNLGASRQYDSGRTISLQDLILSGLNGGRAWPTHSFRRDSRMIEALIALMRDQDAFAAIEYLQRQKDALAIVGAYADAVRLLYWERKDLDGVVALAQAGIQHAMIAAMAAESHGPERAHVLRSTAKALAYDLASFTWPGW